MMEEDLASEILKELEATCERSCRTCKHTTAKIKEVNMRIAINLNKKLHGDIKIYPEDHNDSYVICGIDRNGVNDENAVPDKDANLAMIMRAMPVVGGLCCQIDINRGKYLGDGNAEKLKQYVKEYVQQSFPEVEITFVEET